MTTGKEELRVLLADLVIYGGILCFILLALQLGCIELTLPFHGTEPEPEEQHLNSEGVLQAIQARHMLCSAAMDLELLLSREEKDSRFLLPDGYTDVSIRVPGTVRAAVDLQRVNMTVSRAGPLVSVKVILPRAEISGMRIHYPEIRWNHAHDWLRVFTADSRSLLIRNSLIAEAERSFPELAVRRGLLIEAERNAAEVITETAKTLGADQVEISFMEGGTGC